MFGLDFLFFGALAALPLAGLPVVLHLLFRRKSPVVLFSTTRFIRASMQRTAARRRVQKWLLLAARMLLVLLLILVAAQPAKRLVASLGDGQSVAAIVIDTSYSMQLTRDQQTLLDRADGIVTNLLQNELSGSTVAIYRGLPDPASESVLSATERLARWTPLQPQPTPKPLADRIAAAQRMLDAQPGTTKWLIVLTDAQAREFPRSLETWTGGNFVVFDLKPPTARSAGITRVALDPDQPLPGVGVEAVVRVSGRSGDSRAVTVDVANLDGQTVSATAPRVVQFDGAGESELRIPLKLPAAPYSIVRARVEGDDDLAWDNAREIVTQTPRQRKARVLTGGPASPAERFVTLALDPSEGRAPDWPLRVSSGASIASDDAAVVAILSDWPTIDRANQLKAAAGRGATIVLLTRPGLADAFATLDDAHRQALLPLLPGVPVADPGANRPHRAAPPAGAGSFLHELLDERFQLGAMVTSRLVMFDRRPDAEVVLAAVPQQDGRPTGLVYRHRVGPGIVYTFATHPDPQFSSLATHPIFLPMIVRCCLPDPSMSTAQNSEIGEPLKLALAGQTKLTLTTPAGDPYSIERPAGAGAFTFARTLAPGLYRWTDDASANVAGAASVQLPSAEAVLSYRDVPTVIPGDQVIVAGSIEDFRAKLAEVTQPSPRWSPMIALVLLLLCLEAMLGNSSRLWKLVSK